MVAINKEEDEKWEQLENKKIVSLKLFFSFEVKQDKTQVQAVPKMHDLLEKHDKLQISYKINSQVGG